MAKGDIVLFYPSCGKMDKYHWFPFPFLYIGPFLEKAGFRVIVIDARVEPEWRSILSSSLSNALCLGITAMTGSDIKEAIEAATMCKDINPRLPIVWGGPHATALPAQTVQSGYADIVVCGQGEHAMTEIVNRIYQNKDYSDVAGIVYKKNGVIHQNYSADRIIFDYDIFPAFHLIDIEKYRSPNNAISIFSVRGCPFQCTFCTTGDKDYSERTFEQVKKEILFVVNEAKFKNIFFQDGTYFVRKKRVMDIARFFIESGLNIKWKAKARANSLLGYSEEEMSLLKKSGLVCVFFGVESGSERVLKNMRKNIKPEDAEKSAEICRRYDIEFYVSFMFAMPHETADDLKDTVNHIRRLKKINSNTIVQNCIYLPLPATPMYEQACRSGYVPPKTLRGWVGRNISSRFEERNDVTWIPPGILKEYIKIYNEEFGDYKHLYEKEKEGTYVSIFKRSKR